MKNINHYLKSWVCGLLVAVVAPYVCQVAAADANKERELIAVLQSNAPDSEKAITCKKLAIYGGKNAVPALAPLLENPKLASWARIALEAIPEPEADAALRAALNKVQGRLLVGVINSIGRRRDAQAVSALTGKLKDADEEVAAAAAAALGRIGGDAASSALVPLLSSAPPQVRSEAAEGCIKCAEMLLASGKRDAAIKLFDTVRQAPVPKQRVLEAVRGAILARQNDGVALLLEQLRSPDKGFFQIGLRTARELPGTAVTQALAAELERTAPERQTALVMALADRNDAAALPAIRKAMSSGSKTTRLAALSALERIGTSADLPALLDVAVENDAELSKAAKTVLLRLPGREVETFLTERLAKATGKMLPLLIEIAAQRRLEAALPVIERQAGSADATVRKAAFGAIGAMGDERQVGSLVALAQKTSSAADREDIEKALVAIGNRQREKCVPALMPLAKAAEPALRLIGLHALAAAGGAEALAALKSALQDADESVRDGAVRSLSSWPSNWPDDAAAGEALLELAKSGQKTLHKVLGLRGYLQYVQGTKNLSATAKIERIKAALPLMQRAEEKRIAISAAGAIQDGGSLEILLALAEDQNVAEDAFSTIATLAARDDLKNASKDLRKRALQMVVDKSTSNRTRQKASQALKGLN